MDIQKIRDDDKKSILTPGICIPDCNYTEDMITISGVLDTKQEILCVQYTADFELLAGGFTDGYVRLFKPEKGQCFHSLIDEEILKNPCPVTSIKRQAHKSKNNYLTSTYTNGCVKCWDYKSGEVVYTIHEDRQTLGMAYHPKSSKFVTIGDDAKILLYDEEKRVREKVFGHSENKDAADGHVNRIYSVCFHPKSPNEFISGGWDDTVMFWDLRSPSASRYISGVHICGDGIDISKTGKEILTCAWQRNSQIQIWDYGSGELVQESQPDTYHDSMLYCGKWMNTIPGAGTNNCIYASGGCEPNLLRIVDRNKNSSTAILHGFSKGVYSVDFGNMVERKSIVKKAQTKYATEIAALPKVAFCAGKKIYEFVFR